MPRPLPPTDTSSYPPTRRRVGGSRPSPESRRSEAGVTIIELLIVIAVITLLTAIVMPALTTARASGRLRETVDAARALERLIEAFQADRAGRVPEPGRPDWIDASAGPVDLFGRPYLNGGTIDALANGRVTVQLDAPVDPGNAGRITYRPLSRRRYELVVEVVKDGGLTEICRLGDVDGGARC